MEVYKIIYLIICVLLTSCKAKRIGFDYTSQVNDSIILFNKTEIKDEGEINELNNIKTEKIELFTYEYSKYLNMDSNIVDIISGFNSKVDSPDKKYYVAYFEGETSSKYIGFFDENDVLISYSEINIEPIINFSSNGDYLTTFSLFSDKVFCFDRSGKQILNISYKETSNKNLSLYNAFIDNSGEYLLLNASYIISLFRINQNNILWEREVENRRIFRVEFDSELGVIYSCSLLELEDWSGEDKYAIYIYSIEDGKNLGKTDKASRMSIIDKKIIIKSQNTWYEYEIE